MGIVAERVTLEDVAREASVSIATVDRAINGRPGVHSRTMGRIEAAIAKLNYRPDPVAARLSRNQAIQFCFILPVSGTSFVALLLEQVRLTAEWLAPQRAYIETILVDVFDPEALASTLEGLGTRYQGVATVALDHPRIRDALDELARVGVAVVTLVSDAPAARRLRYIGIDNTAAGRTAGSLMGRFLGGRSGRIGLIAGSMALRDHSERRFGFCQVIGTDYSGLSVQPVSEGRDDERQNEAIVREMLQAPDIIGIYNIGAGNRGIAAALEAAGRTHDIVYIGHELTAHTRRFLIRGIMDACINQDAGHEIRSAARVLMAHCLNEPLMPDQERIRIDVFIRDNLP